MKTSELKLMSDEEVDQLSEDLREEKERRAVVTLIDIETLVEERDPRHYPETKIQLVISGSCHTMKIPVRAQNLYHDITNKELHIKIELEEIEGFFNGKKIEA